MSTVACTLDIYGFKLMDVNEPLDMSDGCKRWKDTRFQLGLP